MSPQEAAVVIVKSIERDLNGRRGLGLDRLDDDIRVQILESWERTVCAILESKS